MLAGMAEAFVDVESRVAPYRPNAAHMACSAQCWTRQGWQAHRSEWASWSHQAAAAFGESPFAQAGPDHLNAPVSRLRSKLLRAADRLGFIASPTVPITGGDPVTGPNRPAAACHSRRGPAGPCGLPTAEQLRVALTATVASTLRETT